MTRRLVELSSKTSPQTNVSTGASQADLNRAYQQLAAIVEGSDDAILTKDLNGVITSWNRGAERIFGYSAEEVIGQPVTLLIPPERHNEEPEILDRIRRGDRIDHYETIRRRKDGQEIHISLSVSPLRNDNDAIVGASKIARDITEQHRAHEQQQLLLEEMLHRIKNVFALADAMIRLSLPEARTPEELARSVQARLNGLATAHALTVLKTADDGEAMLSAPDLHALLATLVSPSLGNQSSRLDIGGDNPQLLPAAVTPLALVFNELATNATKYGALGNPAGQLSIRCDRHNDRFRLKWIEHASGLSQSQQPVAGGFGARLLDMTVRMQLDGNIRYEWEHDTLQIILELNPLHFEAIGGGSDEKGTVAAPPTQPC
ncbi:PAS domain S-box protein [Acuticoccus sp. M5D2P5]|uniref:sensor histidine kinase n=1 Tax=Acuticoccus kalidii TaxID=2910977 RepID=UPI001F16E93C|nr:PAS domain S-box protein [Acuticoccus kalidii]MCF3935285.1 PAS domain S-box protein [Acuticoccus kalidii]